jgi:hypothetical protein
MNKKFTIGSVLAIFVAAILVIVLWSPLNSMVKYAIKKHGSEALQTKIQVKNVDIKPTKGYGSISKITIANPAGFTAPYIFSLENITLKIEIASISKDTIIIDELTISTPHIFFEINKQNQTNLLQLQKQLAQASTPHTATKQINKKDNVSSDQSSNSANSEDKAAAKKIIIKKLVFASAKTDVIITNNDKHYTITLPSITLTDLGGKTGATPKELGVELATKLSKEIAIEVAKSKANDYINDQLENRLNDKQKGVLNKIKGLVN